MTRRRVLACAAALGLLGCTQHSAAETLAASTDGPSLAPAAAHIEPLGDINPRLLRRFQPLPIALEDGMGPRSAKQVDLGRMLYFDSRLSKGRGISCNSCHDLADYGVDHRRFSLGDGAQLGHRNAPTVYHAAGFFALFWDGRSTTVEQQAKVPIVSETEMGMQDGAEVVARLSAIPGYVEAFRDAFPTESEPLTFEHVGYAIGAFERGLLTPGRWDEFLRGRTSALSSAEREGLKTFLNAGCMVCHTGPFLGGSMFERVGVVEAWPNQNDRGREEVTHAAADAMMFKVPSLRNVARTAPYFHDGSAATLDEAVRLMARHQLGLEMSDVEVSSIVAWLGSLTGQLPLAYIARPVLPTDRP
ncbi:MAG: cytochrome c peroxidase [Polyangiaceae bacterium]|jgi:cytochrome c peroxidase